ncbi:MAG TPA: tetratricopeptide repeat protein, partial [Burkholderiaceae bacterium]|nr:tetratricopeptide repeat protein [Burkholderiaceae bacterium]
MPIRIPVFLLAVFVASLARTAEADDAEIVQILGKGDARRTADASWEPAAVKQKLVAGSFVRTREGSQMGLLLKDRTQVRLNQLSILNIKAIASAGRATQLELPQGRAWSQAKQRGGTEVAAEKRPMLEVSTPTAVATIRGTDWELVVEPDGSATITVLSGEVEFHNDHGRVAVLPNEQARAVRGKAPVKSFLSTAPERVQWVTSYRPQPRRWVKDHAGGIAAIVKNIEEAEYAPALAALERDKTLPSLPASLLLADMQLFLGQFSQAVATLAPHAGDGSGDPMAAALAGRALLTSGRIPDAAHMLGNATRRHPTHVEVLLAQAELARVQGDAEGARAASRRVVELDAKNPEAWYMIGRIETEREYASAAREALRRAIALRPDGPGYRGELGTLETFANDFPAAEAAFRAALEQQPDDYVALTGLGVMHLKRGETEAALESFLKAGVIEPRFARAWLFSGVAYYQLGDYARALEALQKASSLDDKDPLPHLMRSLAYFDALELGKGIEAAREAQVRMPFVKSLNQVLTDQKGSANLGSALAAFGMEEWAQAYAYDSYSPYWAGSHLFLADRFSGYFNKDSELFKGFLSDPAVFGASNRYSSMVPAPGHYGSVGATLARQFITELEGNATISGYSVAKVPFSYFASFDAAHGDSQINRTASDGSLRLNRQNLVVGLGVKPTHELAVFAFANGSSADGRFSGDRASGLVDDGVAFDYRRYDAGFNYKFNPTNHAWFKVGSGTEVATVSGAFFSPETAQALGPLFGGLVGLPLLLDPLGRLNPLHYDLAQRDVQWRHSFDLNSIAQLSWGLEYATQGKPQQFNLAFAGTAPGLPSGPGRLLLNADSHIDSSMVYLSGRFKPAAAVEAQIDLHYQDVKAKFTGGIDLEYVGLFSATVL